ncbi:DUF3892 domain-containing protein [Halomonas sp. N3-2A]|uniref:DUF3892 domain-containing protein n=1 Tax=Halomonas sp. N3-2A TaxID=2014541 RepID=UPI000B5B41CE|nr:DUF3892 domain-containing protein [Halomonas sp. N3-2A]ASK18871.1 hypothetical protein CEK60_05955 [Halomonas sp. N3-2A]
MAERRVTATGKDRDGDILRLCNGAYAGTWSPRSKANAINDIETRAHSYYVEDSYGRRANVLVVGTGSNKYLRTNPDSSCSNNLDNLPHC